MPWIVRWLCDWVKGQPVTVYEGPDEDGMKTLAGAICCLAAGAHTKNSGEQQQMAAIFYEAAVTGFNGIPVNAALEAYVLDMIKTGIRK